MRRSKLSVRHIEFPLCNRGNSFDNRNNYGKKRRMTDEMSTTAVAAGRATASPRLKAAVIRMNTSSQLTAAFTELAFNQSTPGFEFDNATNRLHCLDGRAW
uniref:Uncharacterized protein n=1 Tax=Macrostomum lignano TaxID=282301 RepID=A0A1I8FTL7_9PLAT